MGRKSSIKFKKSVEHCVHGIKHDASEIYEYWKFTNLIRARLNSHKKTIEHQIS